jgi:hypothetical protein
MVKTKRLAWLLGLAVAFGIAWYFLWSAVTPSGQPPLTRLTSEQAFVSQFNRAATDVRMVLLLSPT